MKFEVTLEVFDPDVERLTQLFGCDREQLRAKLAGHAQAALSEYMEVYSGRQPIPDDASLLAHRLTLLIRYVFENAVPAQAEIAGLFRSSPSEAQALIEAALGRYRYELAPADLGIARACLDAAVRDEHTGAFVVNLPEANVLAMFNDRLAAGSSRHAPIARIGTSGARFAIPPDSYGALCEAFAAPRTVRA